MTMASWSAVVRDDCFRDPRITVYSLPRALTRLDLTLLRPFGRVHVFDRFTRPFFHMDVPSLFIITGVVGDREIRVTFKRTAAPHVGAFIERQLEKIVGCNGCGDCISLCVDESLLVRDDGRLTVGELSCTSCLECVAGPCEVLSIGILRPA